MAGGGREVFPPVSPLRALAQGSIVVTCVVHPSVKFVNNCLLLGAGPIFMALFSEIVKCLIGY